MTTLAWAARDLFTIALNLLGVAMCCVAFPLGYQFGKLILQWLGERLD